MKENRQENSKKGLIKRSLPAVIIPVFIILSFFCIVCSQAQDSGKKDLKQFYKNNCVNCHGRDGSATGEDGKKLKGEDFTDTDWRNSTEDKKMVKTILKGIFFGYAMPAYKDKLTSDEARSIVTEIIRKSEKGKVIE